MTAARSTCRIGYRPWTRRIPTPTSVLAVLVATSCLPNGGALGSDAQFLNINALSARADTIVHADVASAKSAWNAAHDQIWTEVTLQVRQMLKGDSTKKAISFRQLGGTVGDLTLTVVGMPTFSAGEEVVVFLHKAENAQPFGYGVVGLGQGNWVATTDSDTNQKVFQQETGGMDLRTGEDKQEKLVLSELLLRITKAVERQKSEAKKEAKKKTTKE